MLASKAYGLDTAPPTIYDRSAFDGCRCPLVGLRSGRPRARVNDRDGRPGDRPADEQARVIGRPQRADPLVARGATDGGWSMRLARSAADWRVARGRRRSSLRWAPGTESAHRKRDAIPARAAAGGGGADADRGPSVGHEQLRDVVRCREDIRGDLMRAPHWLGSVSAARSTAKGAYARSRRHRAWLASLKFADRAPCS